ncbi:hypothetical protein [Reichenbachiella sp. MALMAid0571]|uniref:hypothetical protein n=1 Tax=Reichenbachiella sp. MALMAid0571 TaxID=3143939 RepID=UPI0032DE5370
MKILAFFLLLAFSSMSLGCGVISPIRKSKPKDKALLLSENPILLADNISQ